MVVVHFIDVGQGNMTLVEMPDGTIFLYDCNVTDENEQRVLGYLRSVLNHRSISLFINSHRDADHMRGLKRITKAFPIPTILDNGIACGTPDCTEYKEYMEVRRGAGKYLVAGCGAVAFFGSARVRVLNAENPLPSDDGNAQSIVLKIETVNAATGAVMSSVMLAGDSDATTWAKFIVPTYHADLQSDILLASHHGSDSFFSNADGTRYTAHVAAIAPAMTVVSVGANTHGHPDAAALKSYEAASRGSDEGRKIVRTDQQGTIKLVLTDNGRWRMTWTGPSPRPVRRLTPGTTLATRGSLLRGIPPSTPAPSGKTLATGALLRALLPPAATPRPRPGLGASLLRGVPPASSPPSLISLGDLFKTPPPSEPLFPKLLAEILKPPPTLPLAPTRPLLSLGDLLGSTPPPKKEKTPAEVFAEWLMKQRQPPR